MAQTPEKKVKDKCVAQLKTMGAVYFYPVSMGFSSSGVSDIVACYKGCFIAIECKAGKGKTTALQEKFLSDVRAAQGLALVINESNVASLGDMIRLWVGGVPALADAVGGGVHAVNGTTGVSIADALRGVGTVTGAAGATGGRDEITT